MPPDSGSEGDRVMSFSPGSFEGSWSSWNPLLSTPTVWGPLGLLTPTLALGLPSLPSPSSPQRAEAFRGLHTLPHLCSLAHRASRDLYSGSVDRSLLGSPHQHGHRNSSHSRATGIPFSSSQKGHEGPCQGHVGTTRRQVGQLWPVGL